MDGLSVRIPTEIGLLQQGLTKLMISSNAFMTGTIPTEIGLLTRLQQLFLVNINLVGTLPSELGSLQQLTVLALNHNALSGTIPSEIGQLRRVHNLNVQSNALTGTVPTALGSLSLLTMMALANNAGLTGTLPFKEEVCAFAATFPLPATWIIDCHLLACPWDECTTIKCQSPIGRDCSV